MSRVTAWLNSIQTNTRKRKHQEMDQPPPEPIPRAPSPAPTVIINEDPADIVARSRKEGVKVRDFVEEKQVSRTPEIYRYAIQDLANWDAYLRKRRQAPFADRGLALGPTGGHGKVLRRLVALGWITNEEQEKCFDEKDRAALATYDCSLGSSYPWKAPGNLKFPSPIERRINWKARYPPTGQDIPERDIFQSFPVTEELEAEHIAKKARLEQEFASQPTPAPTPSPSSQPRAPLMSNTRRGALARTKTMMSF